MNPLYLIKLQLHVFGGLHYFLLVLVKLIVLDLEHMVLGLFLREGNISWLYQGISVYFYVAHFKKREIDLHCKERNLHWKFFYIPLYFLGKLILYSKILTRKFIMLINLSQKVILGLNIMLNVSIMLIFLIYTDLGFLLKLIRPYIANYLCLPMLYFYRIYLINAIVFYLIMLCIDLICFYPFFFYFFFF